MPTPLELFRKEHTEEEYRQLVSFYRSEQWQASEKELEQRKALSEASNPTVNTPEQAKELERQALEKNPVTKLTLEQAKAIDEQSKATKFSQEQAKAINDAAIERYKPHDPENVNKNEVENPGESDRIKVADSSDIYHNVSADAIDKVPKLKIFEDDELNIAHQKASQNLLAEVSKHKELPAGTEFSIVYDENMNRIPNYDYVQGEVGRVRIDNPNVPYHAFHNHGSNESFSYSDLLGFARDDNMLSLTAQGNLGSKYVILSEPQNDKEGFRLFLKHKGEEKLLSVNGKSYTLSDLYNSKINNVSDEQRKIILEAVEQKCTECMKGASKYGIKYIGL